MNINFKPGSKILEIGGGNKPLRCVDGARATVNMDLLADENVDIVWDISKIPWPIQDNSFDGIFSSYCMEHLEWRKIPVFLNECYRILRPNGKIIAFVPNTYEQCKLIVEKGVNEKTIETLFGSQEFPDYGGVHKTGFSPEYVQKIFREVGFIAKTSVHPDSKTDLVIEAFKIPEKEIFERSYFDGEIGYGGVGYRDFATHYSTARIIKATSATSVLDIGGARGYTTKLLENEGIKAVCMDISRHCYMTRATDSFIVHDATITPWPFKDKEFGLSFSINFLEHIPEEKLDAVIRESIRVSIAGLHGIHFDKSPFPEQEPDQDITHCCIHSEEWWNKKFRDIDPNYTVVIKHPRYLEYEKPEHQPPLTIMPSHDTTKKKLNLGSFTNMFYYGWYNFDIIDLKDYADPQKYLFVNHDVTKGLPFDDNTVDMIFASHLIEHLSREEGKKLLKECYRVLKPDGIIRFCTPDANLLTKNYLEHKIQEYRYINVGVEQAEDEAEAYYNLLLSGHKTIYDETALTNLFQKTGFREIKTTSPFESRNTIMKKETIISHPVISLVIEAIK